MRRKLLLAALLSLILPSLAHAQATQVMPGVTYEHKLVWTPGGPISMYVITAPKPGGLYTLTPLLSNNAITGRETVSSMEQRVKAQMTTIGVNGDFFNWRGGWPSGLLMQAGVIEHHPAVNRSAAGIDSSGNLHVDRVPFTAYWQGFSGVPYPLGQLNEPPRSNSTALFTPVWGASTPPVNGLAAVLAPFPPTVPFHDLSGTVVSMVSRSSVPIPRNGAVLVARDNAQTALASEASVGAPLMVRLSLPPDWSSVTDAVGGGPALVRDGQAIANSGESLTNIQLNGREPRTAIGQRADGGIVMVAADGREPGWSIGFTNMDLAQTLISRGCVSGFALDSGGSTTVAFDGRLLNRPSDPSGERPVAEALVVGYTGVYAQAPPPTLSPNGDGVNERETLTYKVVRPSSVTVSLAGAGGSAGTAPRVFWSGQRRPGLYSVTWNGTDAAGAPAPEGRYRFSVAATDDLGRSSSMDRPFTLDDTLGFVRVGRNARTVSFKLARPANVRVTVETLGGEIMRTVASGSRAAGTVTVRWNGRDGRRKRIRSGTYAVRVAATSPIGLSQLRRVVAIRR
jgi:hypothetical protein